MRAINRGDRGRRAFLATTLKAAGGFAWSPAFLRQAAARPGIPYGVSSGDVSRDRAIIWSRTDRPARMLVEWSTTESFQNAHRVRGPSAGEPSGDLHAAGVVRALRERYPFALIEALGGPRMEQAGAMLRA